MLDKAVDEGRGAIRALFVCRVALSAAKPTRCRLAAVRSPPATLNRGS